MIVTFRDPALFLGNMKACLLAANEDEERPTCCIRVELGQHTARFVATDGHWLWINEIRCESDVTDGAGRVVLFSLEDARKIVKLVDDSKKASSWPVEIEPDARTVRQLSSFVIYDECAKVFPPYQQILPTKIGGARITASFDGQLMGRVVAAFAAACGKPAPVSAKGKKDAAVPLLFHTSENTKWGPEPIVITASNRSAVADALVVLMPWSGDGGSPAGLLVRYRGEKPKEKAA